MPTYVVVNILAFCSKYTNVGERGAAGRGSTAGRTHRTTPTRKRGDGACRPQLNSNPSLHKSSNPKPETLNLKP